MGATNSTATVRATYQGVKPKKNPQDVAKNRIFVPTQTIALLIGNSQYEDVRKAGKTGYVDINQAPQDLERMSKFFQSLNFN